MKQLTKTCLLSFGLLFAIVSFSSAANACCGYDNGFYNGLQPGYYGNTYYGNTYYGGGLIYYPNSQFFYTAGQPFYRYYDDDNCRYIPGCVSCNGCYKHYYRKYRVYHGCKVVGGYRDHYGYWVKKHRVCRY